MHSQRHHTVSRRMLLAGAAAATIVHPMRASSLDDFVEEQMKRAAITGLALGYTKEGQVELARGYGFADRASARAVEPNTMFHIASVTKPVTATAVMMLAEAGKLKLDEPVNHHLDFEVINPAHPANAITFRHLLSHVSSISDQTYYAVDFREAGRDTRVSLGEFLKSYLLPQGRHYSAAGSFSNAAPGTVWDYSNVAYGLLGYAAGRAAGMDLRVYIQERIFRPLAMHDYRWAIAGQATPYDSVDGQAVAVRPISFPDWPAGMLRVSIADFTRFLAASANGGLWRKSRILHAAGLTQMLDVQAPAGLPTWLTGQGLGWMAAPFAGGSRINHWGGDPGVFTAVYLDPAARTGVAIFTNMSATTESKAAVKAIAARMLGWG